MAVKFWWLWYFHKRRDLKLDRYGIRRKVTIKPVLSELLFSGHPLYYAVTYQSPGDHFPQLLKTDLYYGETRKTVNTHGGAKPPPKELIKTWQFWLIQNNFACFTSFPTKLGLQIRNIRPVKMALRMTPNVKLWRHISWCHSYVNFKLLNFPIVYIVFERTIQGKLKYLKYELRYDILNLDKLGAQKRGTPLVK